MTGEPLHVVRIRGVPASLTLQADAHVRNLLRELTLIDIGERTGATGAVPATLTDLIGRILASYATAQDDLTTQAQAALDAGREHFDAELRLPGKASADSRRLLELLEEADLHAAAGALLTMPASTEVRAFRRWLIGEVCAQLDPPA